MGGVRAMISPMRDAMLGGDSTAFLTVRMVETGFVLGSFPWRPMMIGHKQNLDWAWVRVKANAWGGGV